MESGGHNIKSVLSDYPDIIFTLVQYTGGVLTQAACGGYASNDLDHCVQLVGYNTEDPANPYVHTPCIHTYIHSIHVSDNGCFIMLQILGCPQQLGN